MKKGLIRPLSVLAVMILLSPSAGILAQSTYGTISGTVSDSEGAVIAGARVEIINKSTGLTRAVVTDDQGTYKVVNLDPGTYAVAVGAPGMVQCRANQIDQMGPRVVQWNTSVDRDLGFRTVLRLSYTGSKATGLIYSPDLNQLFSSTVGYNTLTATPVVRVSF